MPNTTPIKVVDPREAAHVSGEDYEIACENSLYCWCGLPSGYGYEAYQSDGAGWPTPEQGQADALYSLNCLDGDDHQSAMQILSSWQFFSPEVLQECDLANRNPDQIEAAEEDELRTAVAIRAELEAFANTGTATPDDYLRLYRPWQVVKAETPRSYYSVIVDRLNALLYSVVPIASEAGEVGQLARSLAAAMNSTDLMLDELRATAEGLAH